MMKILVINGPNLNNLSHRDKAVYGTLSLMEIEGLIQSEFPDISFSFLQSNMEGEIVNFIQSSSDKFDGLIINPGGYSHTSVAIKDALEDIGIPKIEVHLSNLSKREEFRQNLLTAKSCSGYISGFNETSYLAAVFVIQKLIKKSV